MKQPISFPTLLLSIFIGKAGNLLYKKGLFSTRKAILSPILNQSDDIMPFFTAYSPSQLKAHLEAKPLDELENLNRSYIPHFERIEAAIDERKKTIKQLSSQIADMEQQIEVERKETEVLEQSRLEMLRERDRGVEGVLIQNSLYISYEASFSSFCRSKENKIAGHKKQISELKVQIGALKVERHLCVKELKILNPIIELKRKEGQRMILTGGMDKAELKLSSDERDENEKTPSFSL